MKTYRIYLKNLSFGIDIEGDKTIRDKSTFNIYKNNNIIATFSIDSMAGYIIL